MPVAAPVISDGSVVVADGRIIDIGRRDDIVGKYPQCLEKKYPCVLMPALVNAHMHLELTPLATRLAIAAEPEFYRMD